MSENLSKLLREALLNNSYDRSSLNTSLRQTFENSYSYLYALQKALIEYEEFHYYSGNEASRNIYNIGRLYVDVLDYACFDIDYEMIHVSDREKYRRSEFYNNQIKWQEIVDNPDIFSKIPVVLIDNKAIYDYTIRCKEGRVTFKLPNFRRNFVISTTRDEHGEEIYLDHKVQVLIIDNRYPMTRTLTNRNGLHYDKTHHTIKVAKSDFSTIDSEGVMFCSLHYPNIYNKNYFLGTTLIEMEDDGNYYIATLSDDQAAEMEAAPVSFYINMLFMENLHKHIFYTGSDTTESNGVNTNIMVLSRDDTIPYAMPIPTEDLLVMKWTLGDGCYHIEKNNSMVELYYPNIYRVKDPEQNAGDIYKIFYFYKSSDTLKYTVLHEYYYRFLCQKFDMPLEKLVDTIYNNTFDYGDYTQEQIDEFKELFTNILNYKNFIYKYGEKDFLIRYLKVQGNEDKDPLEYKVELMNEWKYIEPQTLKNYVAEQKKLGQTYHLFTNSINLPNRIRNNAGLEVGTYTPFDEPCYVFAISNTLVYPNLLELRVFVDGILIDTVDHYRKLFMDYIYIPIAKVTNDSYIELEVLESYTIEKTLNFSSVDDEKSIHLLEGDETVIPTIADLYFVKEDGTTDTWVTKTSFMLRNEYTAANYEIATYPRITKRYTNYSELEADIDNMVNYGHYVADYEGIGYQFLNGKLLYECDYTNMPKIRFTRLNNLKIRLLNKDLIGKDITLAIKKKPIGGAYIIEEDGYPTMDLTSLGFKFSNDTIRIYKNGRLYPPEKYLLVPSYSNPKIYFSEKFVKGDRIYLDLNPYHYTKIYHNDDISDTHFLIDLKGYINKPFDTRYYDVYMNGRKLGIENIVAVSPTKIALFNLTSNYNLEIYEKERDYEYFGIDYNEFYAFAPTDLLENKFMTEDDKKELIKLIIDNEKDTHVNIVPNTNDEDQFSDFTDYRDLIYGSIFYSDYLIPKQTINPDNMQIDRDYFMTVYPTIESTFMSTPMDQDKENNRILHRDRGGMPYALCLNPDVHFVVKHTTDDYASYGSTVMTVGHPTDISDTIKNEKVEFPTDKPIG